MRSLPWIETQLRRDYPPDDIEISFSRVARFEGRRRELIDMLCDLLDGAPQQSLRAAPGALRRRIETERLLADSVGEAWEIWHRRFRQS